MLRSERHARSRATTTRGRGAAAALPPVAERLLPWLGGSVLVAGVLLGVVIFGEDELSIGDLTPLFMGLSATLLIAGLVARRSAQAVATHGREERARPARDELSEPAAVGGGPDSGARSYLHGMERWTGALLELIAHATEASDDDRTREELVSAGEDTDALRALLRASTQHELSLSEVATLHSVSALWETGQDGMEALAASVDPAWHRRWRARAVVERLLRHGPPSSLPVDLPYRT